MTDLELIEIERERRRRRNTGGQPSAAPEAPPSPEPEKPGFLPRSMGEALDRIKQQAGQFGSMKESWNTGAKDSLVKTGIGLKQFVAPSEDDQRVLRQMETEAAADANPNARKGGEITSNIAQFLVPGAKIANAAGRGVQGLSVLANSPRLARALGVFGSGAAASGAEGVLDPIKTDEGYGSILLEKAKEGLKQGAVGGVLNNTLQMAGKLATKAVTPSAEAERLMAEGIVPKLQEGAESGIMRGVGRLTKGAVDPFSEREAKETVQAIARRIAPGEDMTKYTVPEMIQGLNNRIKSDYASVLSGKTFTMGKTQQDEILAAARRAAGGRKETLAMVNADLSQILGSRTTRVLRYGDQTTGISRYRAKFQDRIDELLKSGKIEDMDAAKALKAAREKFDQTVRDVKLSPEELATLKTTDSKWEQFLPLRDAANSAAGTRSLDISKVINSSKKGANVAEGKYPNADILDPANRNFVTGGEEGRRLMVALNRATAMLGKGVALGGGATLATSGPIAAGVLGPAYATSLLGQTRGGARALFGDYQKQKQLADLIRRGKLENLSAPLAGDVMED